VSGRRELFADRQKLMRRLAQHGLTEPAAQQKAELFQKAAAALLASAEDTRDDQIAAFFVPGRIEVLGKHTDYAGGSSMVAAVERGFCLVVRPRNDRQVSVTDALSGEMTAFSLDPELTPRIGHWSNYPMTVARRIARNFPAAGRGADVCFASDLPPAAGMSSSSAMIVAVFLALAEANDLRPPADCPELFDDPMTLAGYLGCVENGQDFGSLQGDRGVGTFGGSEDHTAILCARPGHVLQCAYCPVRFERAVAIPSDYTFAVGTSGVAAEKTGAAMEKYNAASQLARTVAELWRGPKKGSGLFCRNGPEGALHKRVLTPFSDDPHLAAALAHSPDAAQRLKKIIAETAGHDPAALSARLEHFVLENQRIIPAAGDALADGNLPEFGRLVDRSQQGAERLLGNQVPETIRLAALAREHGAAAASAFGAGFGGSVWALVERSRAEVFLTAWHEAYRREFPHHAARSSCFTTAAGAAAFRVERAARRGNNVIG